MSRYRSVISSSYLCPAWLLSICYHDPLSVCYQQLVSVRYRKPLSISVIVSRFPLSAVRYQELLSTTRWLDLMQQFRQENFKLYQLNTHSMFTVALQAGLSALKTPYPRWLGGHGGNGEGEGGMGASGACSRSGASNFTDAQKCKRASKFRSFCLASNARLRKDVRLAWVRDFGSGLDCTVRCRVRF